MKILLMMIGAIVFSTLTGIVTYNVLKDGDVSSEKFDSVTQSNFDTLDTFTSDKNIKQNVNVVVGNDKGQGTRTVVVNDLNATNGVEIQHNEASTVRTQRDGNNVNVTVIANNQDKNSGKNKSKFDNNWEAGKDQFEQMKSEW